MHNNSVTKIHICLGFNSIIIIIIASDRRRLRFCVVGVGLCTTVGSLAVLVNNNNSEYGVCLGKEERRERLSTYLGEKNEQ